MSRARAPREVGAIVVTPGAWSVHVAATAGDPLAGETTCSGYGSDWLRYLAGERDGYTVPDGCPVVDLTGCTDEERATLIVAGPMVGPALPAGHVHRCGAGVVPWDRAPDPRRDARYSKLGSARALDTVAPDVYATLATRHGGTVTTAGAVRASSVTR